MTLSSDYQVQPRGGEMFLVYLLTIIVFGVKQNAQHFA
jgi:hypothetical protein